MKSCRSFCHLAVALTLLVPGGFFVCYAIAVNEGHVSPYPSWPFVSDTGNLAPESGLFTLFLTWGCFIAIAMIILYYRYVIYRDRQSKKNKTALWIGIISVFGMTVVGAFQWEAFLVPHLVGAFTAFAGAIVYSWLIVAISWIQLFPNIHNKGIVYLRIFLAVLESSSMILLLVFSALFQTRNEFIIAASISEWILIYAALLFISTLGYELSHIKDFTVHISVHDGPRIIQTRDIESNSMNILTF